MSSDAARCPGDARPGSLVTERKKGLEEEGDPRSPAADRRWWGSGHLSGGLEEEPLGLLDPLSSLGRRGSHTSPDMGKKERTTSLTGGGGVR